MDKMQLITPKKVENISFSAFRRDFQDVRRQIDAGTVFRVQGDPEVAAVYENFVKPAVDCDESGFFTTNPQKLHDSQTLQSAIFANISCGPALVDSTIRMRRTKGQGAFVGPHIDKYERLPPNCVNAWVSFSDLDLGEALNFLPPKWHRGTNVSGRFKEGMKISKSHHLLPTSQDFHADCLTSQIKIGEYFAFNSGRTVHCSPFLVRSERITADMRITLIEDPRDARFAMVPQYYDRADVGRFDGTRRADTVLSELWSEYEADDRFGIVSAERALINPERLIEEIRTGDVEAIYAINLMIRRGAVSEAAVNELLNRNPDSAALRLDVFRLPISAELRNRAISELIYIPHENPGKMLSAIVNAGYGNTVITSLRDLPLRKRARRFGVQTFPVCIICARTCAMAVGSIRSSHV